MRVKTIRRRLLILRIAGFAIHPRQSLQGQRVNGGDIETLLSKRIQQTIERVAVRRRDTAAHQQTLQCFLSSLPSVVTSLRVKTFGSCEPGDRQITSGLAHPGFNPRRHHGSSGNASRAMAVQ